jgi:assimilatory nitrate reductase catalytic subunit
MIAAAADGAIRGLWIVCTNPAQSLPDSAMVRRALERCDLVVLQDAYRDTATAHHAHWLLPAASWGEKEGTVTNSERRISRVRAAVPPPGRARADWRIAVDIARRLEARLRPGRPTLFPYVDAESVWNEHRETTRGRDLDITGLDWARLEEAPECWPFPSEAHEGRLRLYGDHRFATPDGRARFVDATPRPPAEPRDAPRPFSLITGRLRDQWHGMSRTGTLPRLFGHAPEPMVELNPQDLARLRLADGDLVRVRSRRGTLVLPARASAAMAPTQAFIAMHWGDEFLAGGVNQLTTPERCPSSLQPELKHCAVRIEPAMLPWRVVGAAWCADAATAHRLRQRLREAGAPFEHLQVTLFGQRRGGVLLQAAHAQALPAEVVQAVADALDLAGPAALHYRDARLGVRRSLKLATEATADVPSLAPERRLEALLLAGDVRAAAWMLPLLTSAKSLPLSGAQWLAAPAAGPAAAQAARTTQVCNCLDVSEDRILAWLGRNDGPAPTRLAGLQQALGCGTQCGSCLPEVRRLVATTQSTSPSAAPSGEPAAA